MEEKAVRGHVLGRGRVKDQCAGKRSNNKPYQDKDVRAHSTT